MELTVDSVEVRDGVRVRFALAGGCKSAMKTIVSGVVMAVTPDSELPAVLINGAVRAIREVLRDDAYRQYGEDWARYAKNGAFWSAPTAHELEITEQVLDAVCRESRLVTCNSPGDS